MQAADHDHEETQKEKGHAVHQVQGIFRDACQEQPGPVCGDEEKAEVLQVLKSKMGAACIGQTRGSSAILAKHLGPACRAPIPVLDPQKRNESYPIKTP